MFVFWCKHLHFFFFPNLDLRFDALGFPRHSKPFLDIFQKYPDMKTVIDHCMKPQIADDGFDDWATHIEDLATQTTACIKLSGLLTVAGDRANRDAMQPYVDHVIACFGAERIMYGSDWPVSRLSMEYGDWLNLALALTDQLSELERQAIFSNTASRFYELT